MDKEYTAFPGAQSVSRAIDLFEALVLDAGRRPARDICAALDLAPSTGRRLITLLVERGLITRIGRGRYAGGGKLLDLAAMIIPHTHVIEAARPRLARLAATYGGTAHLGLLEHDMVTYLVKTGEDELFTRESGQLEAYCTGVGKALLMQLPEDRIASYLHGDFIRLTAQTITEPCTLRDEIERSRSRGYAVDDREMADDLACVAVPLSAPGGENFAISISGDPARFGGTEVERWAKKLTACARDIAARLKVDDAASTARQSVPPSR